MPGDFKKRTGAVGQPTVLKSTDTVATTDDLLAVFVAGGSVSVSAGDIEIGAVELKNATTDDRASITAANTARTTGTLVLATQGIDAAGNVNSTAAPTALYAGSKTSTTPATPVVLAATQAIKKGVIVQALSTNTGTLKVGNASAVPIWLSAGGAVSLEIDDIGKVYIDVTVSGEGCTYLAS
jgi:hypothetical protein